MRNFSLGVIASMFCFLCGVAYTQVNIYPDHEVAVEPITVGTLPACNSTRKGSLYMVTDALLPTFLATVSGGGAVSVLVMCNGSNWVGE